MKKLFSAFVALCLFASCSNYYKAVLAPQPVNTTSITDLQKENRFFILRNGKEAYAMKNISTRAGQDNIQCDLETLPLEHRLHLTNGRYGKMKYRKPTNTDEDETAVLNEVHIYITPGSKTEARNYTLAFDNIQKAEIIEKDKIKTRKSHALGTVITIVPSAIFVGLIIAVSAVNSLKF